MVQPVVSVSGLTVARGSQVILRDLSFQVQAGSNTAIVGPNGAGKSTLLQVLLGILPHQQGEIWLLGQRLSSRGYLPRSIRQAIAYLPQQFHIDPGIPISVGEFVGLGWGEVGLGWPWRGWRQRRQAVRQALGQVEALSLWRRSLSSLSGGETKRVLLAYCLVWPRQLLILDEAPAGLDMRAEAEFYQLLQQLRQQWGWTILQVSHDWQQMECRCAQVIYLAFGSGYSGRDGGRAFLHSPDILL
ncbi:MAG: ATP-binding cassette domain-containing protein [Thermostichales cyanobacterium SZTDM-1c_bins_54]